MWVNLSFVALGGALGAMTRYLLALIIPLTKPFMMGVMVANLLGCFLLGVYIGLDAQNSYPSWVKLLVLTGFLGGLTTFSSLMLDFVLILENQDIIWAIGMILISLIGGYILFYLGKMLV